MKNEMKEEQQEIEKEKAVLETESQAIDQKLLENDSRKTDISEDKSIKDAPENESKK